MRLLIVVAHPDDESFGCGSVLAHAAANRHDTAVVCATLGDAGESRIETDDLAALRESELRAAAEILGVGLVRLLGHVDSGMTGEPRPGALVSVDPALLAAEVQAVIEELRPDVVVTLDAGDGHRDHVAIRDATLTAVDASAHPVAATYLVCLARSSMTRWVNHMRATGGADAYLSMAELGTPDADITLVIDVERHLATRWAAMRAHHSQASPYDDLPDELQHEFLAKDRLRLVRGVQDLLGHGSRMTAAERPSTGFEAVDDQPDVSMLLSAMDETARWEATKELRAWERGQLSLHAGQRLLDVGCGLGDAALALSSDLGDRGEVVGIDGSEVMLAEARVRASDATCRVRFTVGDAGDLDEPDASFDAVRSERMLQWVPDPARAVAEMARVVRPGGLVCLTDSDWSTLDFDIGDPDIGRRVHATFGVDRVRQTTVGGRLRSLAEAAGLVPLAEASATQVWASWNPDESPRPDGWAPMPVMAEAMVEAGQLTGDEVDRFVETVEEAARQGRFTMRLTMHSLIAAAPAGGD
jgi:N-acetyl-1-D-myo-inositol-2-amino-2-deoxy-alpha-D-glucopyranoside deacetylase